MGFYYGLRTCRPNRYNNSMQTYKYPNIFAGPENATGSYVDGCMHFWYHDVKNVYNGTLMFISSKNGFDVNIFSHEMLVKKCDMLITCVRVCET